MILPLRIPAEPFAAVVNEFVEKMDMGQIIRPANRFGLAECESFSDPRCYSAIQAVAEWSDVHWDSLARALNGRRETVDFNFADKVICATVGPGAWITDERISRFYA